MTEYIAKRLILFLPTALLAALIVFTLVRIVPGNAIDALVESDQSSFEFSKADRERIQAELGLDRPLPVQFLTWAAKAVRFDFGTSFWSKTSITGLIRERMARTISLALLGFFIAVSWGVTSGVISAVKRDTWIDNVVRVITVGGLSMPAFFMAVMLFWVLIHWFNWIPPLGYRSFVEDPGQNLKQIIAPALILGYGAGASISRLTRSQLLEVLREDYVRTARAKGLHENVIIVRHAVRNALLPVVTVAGLLIGSLLAGTVIVEQVFAIPGMGNLLITAINRRDYPLIQGCVWVISLLFMTSNLVVDMAYGWINPRVRYR